MSLRISTSQMFYQGKTNILNVQAELYKTQNQLSTGRKILTPKDDPVNSSVALMTEQSKEVNDNYLKNQGMASDQLAFMDSQLGTVVDLMQNLLERAIQGGNSPLGVQDKQAIAEEMRRRFESLVDIANTKDGNGDYLFAGNRTDTPPFATTSGWGTFPATNYSLTNSSVGYSGDDGQRLLQVEASQQVPTSQSGQEVFMRVRDSSGQLTGQSMFDSIKNMINALDASSGLNTQANYNSALKGLQSSLDHVLRIRASVGANMNQLTSLTSNGQGLSVQYQTRLANLVGLDYTSAISDLMQQKTQLDASQQSFAKTNQMSLFQYIS